MTDQPPSYPPPDSGSYPPPPDGGSYPPPPPSSGGYPPPAPGYPPQAPGYPPQAPGYPPVVSTGPGTNGLAIASLVSSLVGWVCGIGPILGIVFGFIALNQIKRSGENGRGLALAGIIIGAVAIVISIISSILFFVLAANSTPSQDQSGYQGAPATVIVVAPQVVWPALAA